MAAVSKVFGVLGSLLVAASLLPAAALPNSEVQFNRDVKPILAESCFHCHGPDPLSRKAKLRFDREEDFFSVRDGVAVVARNQPADSLMWQRIITNDQDDVMPPPDSHNQLKPEQKEIIRRWIEQGAKWQKHWSFIAPERPVVPQVSQPEWSQSPIDSFVFSRLARNQLIPAPEADRYTLARRVALDLTGLPPSQVELDAFIADKNPNAYERYVDMLIAKPSYGEHRARYWLDAARYADTHGMHFDNYREIWPYRDWVIKAYNANMPFDQFTVEQIAGDLLDKPTTDQLIATGFQRCNMTTNEGGVIDDEVSAEYARDRVETVSWVFLGLTANCAVCHDHKFDPITQHDFYAMSAYFRNTTQQPKDGNRRDTPPVMVLPKDTDKARWETIDTEIADAQAKKDKRRKELRGDFDEWLKTATVDSWNQNLDKLAKPQVHLPLHGPDKDGSFSVTTAGDVVKPTLPKKISWGDKGPSGKFLKVSGDDNVSLPGAIGDFERDKPFSVSLWMNVSKKAGDGALISRMDNENNFRGWDVWIQGNEIGAHLVHKWPDDALKVVTKGKRLKRDAWQHLTVTYDGSAKPDGLKIYIDGDLMPTKAEKNTLKSSIRTDTPFLFARRKSDNLLKEIGLQDIRLYESIISNTDIMRLAGTPQARKLLAQPADKRDRKQVDKLFDIISSEDATLTNVEQQLAGLENEKTAMRERGAIAYIQEEKKGSMAMANILIRGEYDKLGDKVTPGVFTALHDLPSDAPKNRLGLARWLVSPQNGLTPRVIVNRLWQEFFGTGIVKTSEDFGIMGDAPVHPDLLDWLAVEFSSDWDVKRMVKLIVMSQTYRQAAVATSDKIEKDADNRFFSRGPRFRMDAEVIRDYALSISGLLVDRIGGPSVKTYQPEGVWEAVGMRESNTKNYKRDSGDALYRRSMYTFWKRMAPPPNLEAFNAPNREISCLRRERTNTPLQALVTLNDPQFVEAARVLAEQLVAGEGDDAAKATLAARRILLRPIQPEEKAIITASHKRLFDYYRDHVDEAKQLLAVGERKADDKLDPAAVAAMTMLCNQLFNLDEVLNK